MTILIYDCIDLSIYDSMTVLTYDCIDLLISEVLISDCINI